MIVLHPFMNVFICRRLQNRSSIACASHFVNAIIYRHLITYLYPKFHLPHGARARILVLNVSSRYKDSKNTEEMVEKII